MFLISEIHKQNIIEWIKEDKLFFETHTFPAMMEKVRNQSFVTFIGVPGSGKTATARHIALILQEEGYEILPIKSIKDVETFCDPHNPQVFVFDDMLGVFGFDMGDLSTLKRHEDTLVSPQMPKSKILMTCREVLYRNESLSSSFLIQTENIVLLNSGEYELNENDKYELLAKYEVDSTFFTSVDLALSSNMFPFLCKQFSTNIKYSVPAFFISPMPIILKVLDEMIIPQFRIQYASMVLLMANQNKLSEEILNNENHIHHRRNFNEIKCKFLEKCKISKNKDNFKFIDALSELEGTYTKKCDTEFSFIHDSMFEILACHFGRKFPELMLKYMDSDYIANYIKVDGPNNKKRKRSSEIEAYASTNQKSVFDFCITLSSEQHYAELAERLFRDVVEGEIYNVFLNEALKHTLVLPKFIEVMETKQYAELQSTFLSDLNEKLIRKGYQFQQEKYGVNGEDFFDIHSLLLDERTIKCQYRNNVRAVSWVIYHGHPVILEYIMQRIIKKTGKIDDLFQTSYSRIHQFRSPNEHDKTANNEESTSLYDEIIDQRTADDIIVSDAQYDSAVTAEQSRLLCLACYSGDHNTIHILLKHVGDDIVKHPEKGYWQCKPLAIACQLGYLNIVKELIKAGADVNANANFNTPLTIACENGHLDIVREMVKCGANVNLSHGHKIPLTAACQISNLDIVRELIQAGADVNQCVKLHSPLTAACENGNLNVVQELIKGEAEVNQRCGQYTPLSAACKNGYLKIVLELLNAGASVNKKVSSYTPLIAACDMGHLSIVIELIKAGSNVNLCAGDKAPLTVASYRGHVSIVHELITAESNVNQNVKNKTPLTSACFMGHIDVVEELINAGAIVNLKGGEETPLTAACFNGHLSIVKKLIEAGTDVNLSDGSNTPITASCYIGNLNVMEELIKAGAGVNISDGHKTPLTAACHRGHLDIVERLIDAGADVNIEYKNETPLTTACEIGNFSELQLLLNAGADVNQKGGNQTPLTSACFSGYYLEVGELINAGANVNLTDGKNSPLTAACSPDLEFDLTFLDENDSDEDDIEEFFYLTHLIIVEDLIKAGAQVNLNAGNKTPLTAACNIKHSDILDKLIEAGADVDLNDGNQTPLTAACQKGYLGELKSLIQAGANVNLSDGYKTPLTTACYFGNLSEVIKLIEVGAEINLNDGVRTPLTTACFQGHLCEVLELIKAGANVNLPDGKQTPLTAACSYEDWELALDLESDVNSNEEEFDYFEIREIIVTELIEAGAIVNLCDGEKTPLTAVCKIGHYYILEVLIKAGADVNLNDGNRTPLLTACFYGHLEAVKLLIKAGADINLKYGNKTPLETALESRHMSIVEELQNAGAI